MINKSVSNAMVTQDNSITIGIATTPKEKREIYRFRYQVYAEEMSKPIKELDHVSKSLNDDMDEWALLLHAKIDGKLIGTARLNIGKYEDYPQDVVEILALDTFRNHYFEHGENQFAFVTKIMIDPAYRSSPVLYLLITKCYELLCHRQIQFVFGYCNFYLIRLYEKLGMHRYHKNVVIPGYGSLVPIILLLYDVRHLRAVHSPLCRMVRQRGPVDTKAVQWFHETFTERSAIVNSQLVGEEELWSILCERLGCPPTEAISLLDELSEAEAKKFLHNCGSLVPCDPGNMLAIQNEICYLYNILISGKLKSLTFINPHKEYTLPGQAFGVNGLTEHNKQIEDIVVTEPSEILVLSGIAFPRFSHSHPEIAHKVVKRMISLTRNSDS